MSTKAIKIDHQVPVVVPGIIFINQKGEILLIKQWKWGEKYSCFVGGLLQYGETITECIIREVKEEVNYNLSPERLEFINVGENGKY